jgi:hypothetical protein
MAALHALHRFNIGELQVDRADKKRLIGMVSLADLLRARARNLEEERIRQRTFHLRLPLRHRTGSGKIASL